MKFLLPNLEIKIWYIWEQESLNTNAGHYRISQLQHSGFLEYNKVMKVWLDDRLKYIHE